MNAELITTLTVVVNVLLTILQVILVLAGYFVFYRITHIGGYMSQARLDGDTEEPAVETHQHLSPHQAIDPGPHPDQWDDEHGEDPIGPQVRIHNESNEWID